MNLNSIYGALGAVIALYVRIYKHYDELERGETPGDQLQGTGFTVFKVRVKNSDALRGKSGGYRVIYYVRTEENVTLLAMYSKSDQADISAETLRRILGNYLDQ